jgi:eukaryotic-like serine/threonine-protein kinase
LTWLDHTGKVLGELGSAGYHSTLALSRDGSRTAFSLVDAQNGTTDIWTVDNARGVPNRFTFNRGTDRAPVWSPDGRRIAFESDRDGLFKIYWKESIRAGDDQLLLPVGGGSEPTDWSSDGQFLLFWSHGMNTGYDLWVLQGLTGDPAQRKPVPYLQTPYDETQGQFRPEPAGPPRWVAYTSNASGSYEVYVQSFPIGSGKHQISTGGGTQPRWRRDGKELFYLAGDGKLMAVDVAASPTFSHGAPRALFDAHVETGGVPQFPFRYDVSADGKRFLVVRHPEANVTETSPITVVVNWTAALKP